MVYHTVVVIQNTIWKSEFQMSQFVMCIPLVLTVFIIAVAPALLIRSLAAVVSTSITFRFDLISLTGIILPRLLFFLMNIRPSVSSGVGVVFDFDLHFNF